MSERIMTLHPDPDKLGVNIEKAKYDQVHAAIVKVLRDNGDQTYTELATAVTALLRNHFNGSIPWYVVTVKLDMEARKQLQRVSGTRPTKLRLAGRREARG